MYAYIKSLPVGEQPAAAKCRRKIPSGAPGHVARTPPPPCAWRATPENHD